jgi:hypothetical protein
MGDGEGDDGRRTDPLDVLGERPDPGAHGSGQERGQKRTHRQPGDPNQQRQQIGEVTINDLAWIIHVLSYGRRAG